MKSLLLTPIVFLFMFFTSDIYSQSTFTGDNTGATIDDASIVESKANVNLAGNIGQDYIIENVEIDILHDFVGQLEIKLISPGGTSLDLSISNGGYSSDFLNTLFIDNANDITNASGPFQDSFQPEGGNFISKFNSSDVNGNWTLEINDTDVNIDGTFNSFKITFSSAPNCPAPNNLSVTNINATDANLSWGEEIPNSSAFDGYEWVVMNAGDTPDIANAAENGTVANGVFSDTVSNLSANQQYDAYIRSVCDDLSNEVSDWSFPVSFTTDTACTPLNVPFTEDFESTSTGATAPDCWSVINTGSGDNQVVNFGGPFGNVYRLAPNTQPGEYLLISPQISELTTDGIKVDFKARVTSNSSVIQIGTIAVVNDVNTFNAVDTKTISSSNFVNFESNITSGSDSYFAIRIDPSSVTSTGAINFDDINFQDLPDCTKPSNLEVSNVSQTDAVLNWNEETPASATDGYEWVVMASGNAPDTGNAVETATVTSGTLSDTVNNLSADQEYDAYIRSICDSSNSEVSSWSSVASFITACNAATIPFSENFESSSTGSPSNPNAPDCWRFINSGSGATFVSGFGGQSGSQSYSLENGPNPSGDFLLISPEIANISTNGVQVSFSVQATQGDELEIGTMSDFTNASTFNLLDTKTSSSSTYEDVEINIPSGGSDVYFAVRIAGSNFSFTSFNLDNFNFNAIPNCTKPSGLGISNITQNGAKLSWDEEVPSTATSGYDYFVTSNGTVPNGGTTPTGSVADGTTTATLSGLNSNTDYDAYVRSDCDVDGKSDWSSAISFTTSCSTLSIPFSENFSSTSTTENCWTVVDNNNDGDQWNLDYGSNTLVGDEVATLTTDLNSGNNDDYLITPTINLTGNEQLRFSYRVQSSSEPNDFQVTLSTTGTNVADFTNTLLALDSYSNTTYAEKTIDLSSFTGNVNIAFHVPNGGLDGWNLYIDNVNVEEIPTCLAPTNLTVSNNNTGTTADLDWDADASASSGYEYFVTTNGTVPDENTTPTGSVASGTTTATLSGLTPQTNYDAYVRSDCGGGDISDWSSAVSFTTPCETVSSFPYNEPFDTFLNDCWEQAVGVSSEPITSGSSSWTADTFNSDNSAYINMYNNTTAQWLITEKFDLGTATDYQVVLDIAASTWNDLSTPANFSTDDEVGLMISTDGGSTWSSIATYTDGSEPSNTGQTDIYDLSTYTGVVKLGIYAIASSPTSSDHDLYIRNFKIEETPCITPSNLAVSNISITTADLNWDTESTATSGYDYFVTSNGTVPDSSTNATGSVASGTTTATLTGLTGNTDYNAYIRSDCGGGNKSAWSSQVSFTTLTNFCGGNNFFDNGGSSGNYSNFSNETTVISPINSGNVVSVEFLSFNTENSYDGLVIYDGPDDTAPLIDSGGTGFNNLPDGAWTGTGATSANGKTFTSSHSSGALTFVFISDGSNNYEGWEANVTCASCITPSNLAVSNTTTTTADLNWDTQSTASNGYDWVIMAAGEDPDVGTPVDFANAVSSTSVNASGLSADTDYDAYVRSDCGNGDKSNWSSAESFTTDCLAIDAPYANSFENFPEQTINYEDCWSATSSNTFFAASGQQSPGSTGPDGAADGNIYVYFDGNNSNSAELETPIIDLSTLTNDAQLLFSYYMYGLQMGTLKVKVDDMDGSGYVEEFSVSMQQHDQANLPWTQQTVDLSAYSGTVQIRFVGIPGTGSDSDIAIDNVSIDNKICAKPQNLSTYNITDTSVDLDWAEESPISASDGYEWVIMNDGDAPDTGNAHATGTVSDGTFTKTVTGIEDNLTYQAYVRSGCGSGFKSNWSSPASFTTLPSCPEPVNLTLANVTTNSVDLSWGEESPSSATDGYQWLIIENGATPDIGNAAATGTVANGVFTASVSGLDDNTIYDAYVRSVCDASTSEVSNWEGAFFFETEIITTSVSETSVGSGNSGSTNDSQEWLFESPAGLPLEITFGQANFTQTNGCSDFPEFLIGGSEDSYLIFGSSAGFLPFPCSNFTGSSYTSDTGQLSVKYVSGSSNDPGIQFSVRVVKDYSYGVSGGFSPSNPSGVVSAGELTIESGTASIGSLTEFKKVTVESDAVLDLNADIIADLTFISDAAGIAQLADLSGSNKVPDASGTTKTTSANSNNITGNVTVERFIPVKSNDTRAFRFLTSSVNSNKPIRANWQEGVNNTGTAFPADNENPNPGYGTHITGSTTGSNGFDASISGNPSMYTFDNTSADGDGNQGNDWNAIPNTNSKKLKAGKAYRIFIRGDRGYDLSSDPADAPNSDVTLRATGDLISGVHTETLSDIGGYYSLIGNPYQAIVDMNAVMANPGTNNVNTNYYWIWDPNLSPNDSKGAYVAVDLSDGSLSDPSDGSTITSSDANEFVMPGQSFFVQTASDGSADLQFKEGSKNVSKSSTEVFSDNDDQTFINLKLYHTTDLNNQEYESDVLQINFNDQYSNAATLEDADKLGNPGENLARVNNTDYLSIEKRKMPTDGESLELFTNGYTGSDYTFVINVSNLPDDVKAYVVDNYTDDQTLLSDGANQINFSVDPSIPESIATDRFSIDFEVETFSVDDNELADSFTVYPNPVTDGQLMIMSSQMAGEDVELNLYNITGQSVLQTKGTFKSNGKMKLNLGKYQAGVYFIEVSNNGQTAKERLIIK